MSRWDITGYFTMAKGSRISQMIETPMPDGYISVTVVTEQGNSYTDKYFYPGDRTNKINDVTERAFALDRDVE